MSLSTLYLGDVTVHTLCTVIVSGPKFCSGKGETWHMSQNDTRKAVVWCRCANHTPELYAPSGRVIFNSLDDVKAHIAMREL